MAAQRKQQPRRPLMLAYRRCFTPLEGASLSSPVIAYTCKATSHTQRQRTAPHSGYPHTPSARCTAAAPCPTEPARKDPRRTRRIGGWQRGCRASTSCTWGSATRRERRLGGPPTLPCTCTRTRFHCRSNTSWSDSWMQMGMPVVRSLLRYLGAQSVV